MIELPETITLASQLDRRLKGRSVTSVHPPTYLHKFTSFSGDPAGYEALLKGMEVTGAAGRGMFVYISFGGGVTLGINDGVNICYGVPGADVPSKYQLLITFDDGSFLWFTVAMYGGISLCEGEPDDKYHRASRESISPLSRDYDRSVFDALVEREEKDISLKALLASGQRIPGVGNGCLQDILFNARLHPKRKIRSLSGGEKEALFASLKKTLSDMAEAGGRDTEKDIFGNNGGYVTVMSKNTLGRPCPRCGSPIARESYMGGAVYFCPNCQKQ